MGLSNKENPPTADFYVRLVTPKAIRENTVKNFYNTVRKNSPQNTLGHFETLDENDAPKQAAMSHYVNEDEFHVYEIPMTRNLNPDEIVKVVEMLDAKLTEGDFLFETSTFDDTCCYDNVDEEYEAEVYDQIAEKFAERQHNDWMQERISNGWHYGDKRCDESQSHPLLRDWSQLSEDQKQIDYELPNKFFSLLEEFGYAIVKKEDLE